LRKLEVIELVSGLVLNSTFYPYLCPTKHFRMFLICPFTHTLKPISRYSTFFNSTSGYQCFYTFYTLCRAPSLFGAMRGFICLPKVTTTLELGNKPLSYSSLWIRRNFVLETML